MEFYLFFMLFIIPLFYYGAANGSHDFLSIIASSLVLAYWLFTGLPYYPALICVMVWFIMSVFWSSHYGNSINDLLMIASMFTVIFAVQGVDKLLLMLFSIAPAVGMAGLEVYQWKNNTDDKGAFFGNTNHAAVYYVINFFISLWLLKNISMAFLPFSLLLLAGLFTTKCRGAILAFFVGLGTLLFREFGSTISLVICAVIGITSAFIIRHKQRMRKLEYKNGLWGVGGSFRERSIMYMKALRMIIEKPVWGWGLGTFKKEHQFREPALPTHRVHNDILEIIYETGLVGFGLIVYFFYKLNWYDPYLTAALVAGIVSSCFFFTFREAHTAVPLMMIIGFFMPKADMVTLYPLIAIMALFGIANILWVHLIKKIIALAWWGYGSFRKTKEDQIKCVANAVKWFPNTEYLSRHAYFLQQADPGGCYSVSCQMLYNYDGRVVLWEAYDQLARASFKVGAVHLADYYNHQALEINPNFPKGLKFREHINTLFKNLQERNNGTMAVS